MIPDLVTLAEAREHLRLDWEEDSGEGVGPDDGWLAIFIPAVSEAIARWVKVPARLYVAEVDSSGAVVLDSSGEPVPAEPLVALPVVKAAALVELELQYRFRSGEGTMEAPAHAGYGYTLGRAATNLLTPLRRPTVA